MTKRTLDETFWLINQLRYKVITPSFIDLIWSLELHAPVINFGIACNYIYMPKLPWSVRGYSLQWIKLIKNQTCMENLITRNEVKRNYNSNFRQVEHEYPSLLFLLITLSIYNIHEHLLIKHEGWLIMYKKKSISMLNLTIKVV